MIATTKLQVPRNLVLDINIQMTVEEADELLKAMQDVRAWPSGSLKTVLQNSLHAARMSHVAVRTTEG
jgi:hypothetical protein